MPISNAYYVTCDDCGTPAEISTESKDEAAIYAIAQGFLCTKRPRRFLCPEHRPEGIESSSYRSRYDGKPVVAIEDVPTNERFGV